MSILLPEQTGRLFRVQHLKPEQSRAARAFLNWSRADLSKQSNVSVTSISNFENALIDNLSKNNAIALQKAFETAGIRFVENGLFFSDEDKGNA